MYQYFVAPLAKVDIHEIHDWTIAHFGYVAAERYHELIQQAIWDVVDDPERPGSREVAELSEPMRSYHIKLSRGRAPAPVKRPRHFLLYRVHNGERLEIVRVLHDRMEPSRHTEPRQDDRT